MSEPKKVKMSANDAEVLELVMKIRETTKDVKDTELVESALRICINLNVHDGNKAGPEQMAERMRKDINSAMSSIGMPFGISIPIGPPPTEKTPGETKATPHFGQLSKDEIEALHKEESDV